MSYEFEKRKLMNLIDEDLYEILENEKCIIAGGAITSLFTRNEINDLDVYFRNEESLIRALKYMLDNAMTVAHTDKATLFSRHQTEIPVQFIHFKFFESAQEIFDTFDFTVCMGAYDFETGEFIFDYRFLQHNAQRMLQFNHDTAYPIVSALRLQKYEEKGYTISKPEFLKIMLTINNLKVTSYKQIKEQLGGMYGVSYDKLYEDIKDDEKFDILKVIERLNKIILDDDYFKDNKDSFAYGKEVRKFINNTYIKGDYDIYKKELGYGEEEYIVIKDNHVVEIFGKDEIEIKEEDIKTNNPLLYVYKNVERCEDGTLRSFYDKNFVYEIGVQTEAKHHSGLFFVENLKEIDKAIYSSYENRVVLKSIVKLDDIIDDFEFKKCIPLEVIEIK